MQIRWLRVLSVMLITLFIAGCGSTAITPTATSLASGGAIIDPPRAVNDATFTDQAGKTRHLIDLKGKLTLLFFGYTNCPDVCPITLSDFSRVRLALGKQSDKANFVFISVDPARDTPPVLTKYLASFDPSFIGLATDNDTLQKVAKDFEVVFAPEENGVVGHSTRSYLLDAQGRLRVSYPVGVLPDLIAADMQNMLSSGG